MKGFLRERVKAENEGGCMEACMVGRRQATKAQREVVGEGICLRILLHIFRAQTEAVTGSNSNGPSNMWTESVDYQGGQRVLISMNPARV